MRHTVPLMTLGDTRESGVRSLAVWCLAGRHIHRKREP
jgi:hypothetical protein